MQSERGRVALEDEVINRRVGAGEVLRFAPLPAQLQIDRIARLRIRRHSHAATFKRDFEPRVHARSLAVLDADARALHIVEPFGGDGHVVSAGGDGDFVVPLRVAHSRESFIGRSVGRGHVCADDDRALRVCDCACDLAARCVCDEQRTDDDD